MIIDAHAHLVPPPLLEAIRQRQGQFPSIRIIEEGGSLGFSFAGGKATRPVAKGLTDIGARAEWMAKNAIERQVVGGWLDMYGYEIPAEEGAAWASLINEHLSALDDRFMPLATVPLQNGATAASVLKEACGGGFAGVMIGTQPKGVGGVLDDSDLDPFWKAADDLGAVVFVHPVFESGDDRVHDYGMANAVGRVTDTMIAVSRLLYSGHLQRYPNVKLVIAVGGAGLPFILGRLRRNYELAKDTLADPEAGLRAMYYDTIVQDPRALKFVAEVVGADRLMMGSDMPFPIGDLAPLKVVEAAGFGEADKASINGGLVEKLWKRA